VNNFNPTPNQTYGAVLNTGITITDNQLPPGSQGDNDIVSYTPTGSQGLCMYSSSTNSITGQFPQLQLYPDGTESKLTASATNGLVVLASTGTGGAIQLNATTGVKLGTQPILNFSTWGTLSATSGTSGLISNVNITSTGFGINDSVNNSYLLYTNTTPINYGLVIANTTGGNGTLTLSNNSTTNTILSSTTDGLTINDAIILPAQTVYTPSTTYGNVGATQQFVQLAVASQGGGDASLSANQTFTGINTFSGTAQTSATQTFPQLSSNQFASLAYVNNLGETQGSNLFNISSPQLGGAFNILYATPNGNAGSANYFSNAGVGGTVYTYVSTSLFCTITQTNLSPINNCIFTLTFVTGTPPTTANENMSLRVINGGTQYTLPLAYANNQFTTSNPISLITSQGYKFYIQGSYI